MDEVLALISKAQETMMDMLPRHSEDKYHALLMLEQAKELARDAFMCDPGVGSEPISGVCPYDG